jgi:hypothetical protein
VVDAVVALVAAVMVVLLLVSVAVQQYVRQPRMTRKEQQSLEFGPWYPCYLWRKV